MRLGCEVTAIDINPVAWFILKCTLEYPQKLAGQKRPLPEFVRTDAEFMESFFKAQGFKGATLRSQLRKMGFDEAGKSRSRQDSLAGCADRQGNRPDDRRAHARGRSRLARARVGLVGACAKRAANWRATTPCTRTSNR